MKKLDLKLLLPHIIAIALFAIIALVYFYPVLEGYKIKQGDITKHKAMSHEIFSHKEKYNELALWSGNMFAGMPSYVTSTVRYKGNIIPVLNQINRLGLPVPASILFAYLIGFYILLLCLKINPRLAIVGAIAFGFSSYFFVIIEAGHNSKAISLGLIAPILGGFIQALRGNLKVGLLLISLFTAMQVYANHLQISYYLLLILTTIWIVELIHFVRSGKVQTYLKRTVFILLAAMLGVLPNLGALMTMVEYSKASTRGGTEISIAPDGKPLGKVAKGLDKEYITQWSNGIDETWTLLSPNVKGGASIPILGDEKEVNRLRKEDPKLFNIIVGEYQNHKNPVLKYFGNQPIVSGPVYIGAILILLAILALVFVRTRLVLSLGIISVLAIFLSFGKNFMGLTSFFIDYFPGYNKFRVVAMILVIVEFTVPLLAILFLDYLFKNVEVIKQARKKLFLALGAFIFVLGIFYIAPDTFVDLISDKEEALVNQRLANNSSTSYDLRAELLSYRSELVSKSILTTLGYVAIGVVLLLMFVFGKLNKNILVLGLGILILVDLWTVNKDYLNNKENPRSTNASSKYEGWVKVDEQLAPFSPSAVDLQIFQKEARANPLVSSKIDKRLAELRKETPRLNKRKIVDVQFSELMEETHYRVLNTNVRLDQDATTPYFHKSLGGYSAAKIKRYQDIVDFYLGIEHYQLKQITAQLGEAGLRQYLPEMKMTNMLNAKYIIGPGNSAAEPEKLFENPYAFGNVWLVNQYKIVENADSAIIGLKNTDLKQTVLVDKNDIVDGLISDGENFSALGNISLTSYNPNVLKYEFDLPSNQLAVFSEIFYDKGWKAYINGEEQPYFRGNFLLRGMKLPQGKGEIEFRFEPKSYSIGNILSWISSAILLIFLVWVIYSQLKQKQIA